jgi:hypothetical protein
MKGPIIVESPPTFKSDIAKRCHDYWLSEEKSSMVTDGVVTEDQSNQLVDWTGNGS